MTTPSATPMPHVEGVRHLDVVANGVRFHVAEAGEGPPVLLVHGWPQHWYAWRKLVPPLSVHRRLIMPDLRGFGWSDAPPGRYDKQGLADDLAALLDVLELDQVDLIAHDWGAWCGYLLALDHPERIRRYLALNMAQPWPPARSPRDALAILRLWYQVLIAAPGLGRAVVARTDFVKRVMTSNQVQPGVWRPEDLESFAAVLREPARSAASVQLYRTFLLRELGPFIAGGQRGRRLKVPTLMLHGTHDLAVDRRLLHGWEPWADDMRLELRDDAGHFIAEELPAVVAARAEALFG
jgi:pimeloyl-ACP methyl ester carboxylesterase